MFLLNSVSEIGERGKYLPHIFSFLTCFFSLSDEKESRIRNTAMKKEESEAGKRYVAK